MTGKEIVTAIRAWRNDPSQGSHELIELICSIESSFVASGEAEAEEDEELPRVPWGP